LSSAKLFLVLSLAPAAVLWAVPLPVVNPGFETTVADGFTYEGNTYVTGNPLPDHTFTGGLGGSVFVGDSASGANTGGTANIFPWTGSSAGIVFDSRDYVPGQGPTEEGAYVSIGADQSGSLSQTITGTSFQPNTTYTLSVQLSDRRYTGGPFADNVTFPNTIQLSLAGNGSIELFSGVQTFTSPAPGSSSIATYVVTTGSTPEVDLPTGDLIINFRVSGFAGGAASQAVFDNVTLDAVPEPASLALLSFGAFGLLARRRA